MLWCPETTHPITLLSLRKIKINLHLGVYVLSSYLEKSAYVTYCARKCFNTEMKRVQKLTPVKQDENIVSSK